MNFSTKTQIPPSATVTINGLAQAKKLAGQRVYNLSAGEPILDTSSYLKDAVDEAMKEGRTLYPPVPGVEELRTHASQWINELYGTNYGVKNTLISCGGKFGIYLSLQALLNDGDEVLVIAPYWVSYPPMVKLFGGVPVIVNTEEKDGWKVRVEDLEKACTSKTKLLILNNGSNPTGVLYSREELKAILALAKDKNLIVMSDEVYSGLVFDGHQYVSCGAFSEYSDRVIVIQSCSKNFGMTGWRVGLIFAPEEMTKMLIKLQGQSITGTSIISQWAAISALKQAKTITAEINKEMQHRRDVFTNTFNELFPGKIPAPLSAFYSFIPLTAFGELKNFGSAGADDVKFCEKVLDQGNIALVPGSAFGKPGYVRASFGAKPQELKEALNALCVFLKK